MWGWILTGAGKLQRLYRALMAHRKRMRCITVGMAVRDLRAATLRAQAVQGVFGEPSYTFAILQQREEQPPRRRAYSPHYEGSCGIRRPACRYLNMMNDVRNFRKNPRDLTLPAGATENLR